VLQLYANLAELLAHVRTCHHQLHLEVMDGRDKVTKSSY
jgi:hypothetical protein